MPTRPPPKVLPPPPPLPDATELAIAQDFSDGIVEVVGALIGPGGAATGSASGTFAWVTRQNVASGNMLSKLVTVACALIHVAASSAITVAKQPVTYPANGSQFSDQFIAHIPPTSLQPWTGFSRLNPNDIIYVDSLSGLGTADSFVLTFVYV